MQGEAEHSNAVSKSCKPPALSIGIVDAAFLLLTVGGFLLTVKLFDLQLAILACLLTVGAFLLTALAFVLTIGAFCLQWESASNKGLQGL